MQVLSRYNMLKQKLTVSRKQATVSCSADGTATLTSVGRGATLWRERGGPWSGLMLKMMARQLHPRGFNFISGELAESRGTFVTGARY